MNNKPAREQRLEHALLHNLKAENEGMKKIGDYARRVEKQRDDLLEALKRILDRAETCDGDQQQLRNGLDDIEGWAKAALAKLEEKPR